ncbi:MAG TPA: hypothetical protein VNV16_06400 [Methylibium sp.]|nr:hypothetical protein [Methylibium sp.]
MAKLVFKYVPPSGLSETSPASGRDARTEIPGEVWESAAKCERWWYESSYDLRTGLDVSEDDPQTIPGDLLDELFKP